MAIPKVFISSTCFDLSEIREQLSKFVSSFGFDPILSDHGDVFYHPDLHTHEACVHEVSNCQLFILIIGGRYGGSYTVDKTKSITNAEYEAAINHGIPVFTYIKKDVLSDHHIYTTNSKNEIANQITYPSITKQTDSLNIFNFINQVRRQNKNNSYEGFDNFGQIESHLRKQWAGMFFDFLRTKEIKSQIDATNHLLSNLKSSNNKLEELVKSLYLNSSEDSSSAQNTIDGIEIYSMMEDFFNKIIEKIDKTLIDKRGLKRKNQFLESLLTIDIQEIAKIPTENKNCFEYLLNLNIFNIKFYGLEEYKIKKKLLNNQNFIDENLERPLLIICNKETMNAIDLSIFEIQDLDYIYENAILKTNQPQRQNFFKKYFHNFIYQ